MRRWRSGLALLLALSALAALPPADLAAQAPACQVARSRTILANSYGRIYEVRLARPDANGATRLAFACLYRVGRPFLLETSANVYRNIHAGPWALGPGHAAAFDMVCVGVCATGIDRIDLTTGELASETVVCTRPSPRRVIGCAVHALTVGDGGATAWISAWEGARVGRAGRPIYEVDADAGDGVVVRLDAGAGIDRRSLALQGATVTWTKARESRSATLGAGT